MNEIHDSSLFNILSGQNISPEGGVEDSPGQSERIGM